MAVGPAHDPDPLSVDEGDDDPLAWLIDVRATERAVDGAGKTGLAIALLGLCAALAAYLSRRPRSVVPALPRGTAAMLWDGGLLALGGGLLVALLAAVVSGVLMVSMRRSMRMLGEERPQPRVGEAFGPLRVLYADGESLVMARASSLAVVGLGRLLPALGAVVLAGVIAYAATQSRTLFGTFLSVVMAVALLAFAGAMLTPASTEFRVEPTRAGPVLRIRRTRFFFWHHPVEAGAGDVRLELKADTNTLLAVCTVARVGERAVEDRVELCRLGRGSYATFQRERLVRALCERLGIEEPTAAEYEDDDEEEDERDDAAPEGERGGGAVGVGERRTSSRRADAETGKGRGNETRRP
jgi:hypothetical protein